MTRQPVCLLLTRPLWQGADDALADALRAAAPQKLPLGWSLRVVSTPLQRLVPIADSPLGSGSISCVPSNPAKRLLVATSPASVEALGQLPATEAAMLHAISAGPSQWVLTGVGEASCFALVDWFERQRHRTGQRYRIEGTPSIHCMPASAGSGAVPFLQWVRGSAVQPLENCDALLLEAQDNQPALFNGLTALGLRCQRLSLYRRIACPMPVIDLVPPEELGVLVSSSNLVEPAVAGLAAQSIDPQKAFWLTHHPRIAEALTAVVGCAVSPAIEGLAVAQILSGMARLNLRV